MFLSSFQTDAWSGKGDELAILPDAMKDAFGGATIRHGRRGGDGLGEGQMGMRRGTRLGAAPGLVMNMIDTGWDLSLSTGLLCTWCKLVSGARYERAKGGMGWWSVDREGRPCVDPSWRSRFTQSDSTPPRRVTARVHLPSLLRQDTWS